MPVNQRSHRLTDAYRLRLLSASARLERTAADVWPRIQELDTTTWPEFMASQVTRAQVESVRLTAGYLSALIASETGRRGRLTGIPAKDYAGLARDGRSLREALRGPVISVRSALKAGKPPAAALRIGLVAGQRMVGFEVMQTPRDALVDAVDRDPRTSGFQRSVAGTCGACMALSGSHGPQFPVHPGCACIPMPVVSGVRDRFPLPTGAAIFHGLTKPEQDRALGQAAAQKVRDGDAALEDLVSHSPVDEGDDILTQKPVQDLPNETPATG